MTIKNLRDLYPYALFEFFKDGYTFQGSPRYHQTIKSYTVKSYRLPSDCIFIEL